MYVYFILNIKYTYIIYPHTLMFNHIKYAYSKLKRNFFRDFFGHTNSMAAKIGHNFAGGNQHQNLIFEEMFDDFRHEI